MEAAFAQRLRITFRKEGNTRFISHLDLARALERAFNRSRLPLAYSQGFNRRPRMQLAAALPLGFSSECELADIWLKEELLPDEVKQRIVEKMAPGIMVLSVQEVPLSAPSLQSSTSEASYTATLLEYTGAGDLQERVDELLRQTSHVRLLTRGRKNKSYDLRPLIIGLEVSAPEGQMPTIDMRLHLKPGRTGRPDEVLLALGLDPFDARVHRTQLHLVDSAAVTDGALD